MSATRFRFLPVAAVWHGEGSSAALVGECTRLGSERVLLVGARSLAAAGVLDRLAGDLGDRCAGVYSGGRAHVPLECVLEGAEVARAARCDALVTVGGSSQHDLGKAIALALGEGLADAAGLRRFAATLDAAPQLSGERPLPVLAISTTLSAGEFTPGFGITDDEHGVKLVYLIDALTPRVVFLDPVLAAATPPWLWASTGIRAVDHCVEQLCSPAAHPITDALCTDALRRLVDHLPAAAAERSDLVAAGECQVAAWQSFFGVVNVMTGLSHALGHQLGGRCGVPHGVTSCIVLPHVMRFNLPATEAQQQRIAGCFGDHAAGAAARAADHVASLVARLGQPARLRDVGVERGALDAVAEHASADFAVRNNPRPASLGEVREILRTAW